MNPMKHTCIAAILLIASAATTPTMAYTADIPSHVSLSNNEPQQPLYVIDNRAVTLDEVEALAPTDIESITIVKDEDAKAYEHLGDISNGVMIINLITADETFVATDIMPMFLNGGIETFQVWVMQNIRFPAEMVERGKEANLIVQFTVNSNGYIPAESIKFLQEAEEPFMEEARRVLLSSPRWVPGIENGKKVSVQFVLPVMFTLSSNTTIGL